MTNKSVQKDGREWSLAVTEQQDNALRDELRAGLSEYAVQSGHAYDKQHLSITVRDHKGTLIGGLTGESVYAWLYVEYLWVAASRRGTGLGTALMREAERVARERGCRGVYLNTAGFQARQFYEKLGYTVFGILDEEMPQRTRYYLSRLLYEREE